MPKAEDAFTGNGFGKPKRFWNSLRDLSNIGTFRGKESYHSLKQVFNNFADELWDMHMNGITVQDGPDGHPVSIPIRFWGGGDLSFWSKVQGMGGDFSSVACNLPHCDCPSIKLGDLHHKCQLRSMNHGHWLAHQPNKFQAEVDQFPFKCPAPCCADRPAFTCQEECDNDPRPAPSKACDRRRDHFGVAHGCPPLLPVPPSHIIPCSLHLLLTVCKRMWKTFIVDRVWAPEQVHLYALAMHLKLQVLTFMCRRA